MGNMSAEEKLIQRGEENMCLKMFITLYFIKGEREKKIYVKTLKVFRIFIKGFSNLFFYIISFSQNIKLLENMPSERRGPIILVIFLLGVIELMMWFIWQ